VKLEKLTGANPKNKKIKKKQKGKKQENICSKNKKKNQANLSKPFKSSLIFKISYLWNSKPGFNQKT